MKILVINGSPKGEQSDTLCITRAFLDGMNGVCKNEISQIDVIRKHIAYCCGDLSCMKNGGVCVHDDDMTQILQDMLASDLLLFSFPLYGFGVPAPLKALLDRTLPLGSLAIRKTKNGYAHVAQADFRHLRYVVISGCGFPNATHNFEALRMQFTLRFAGSVYLLTVPQAPLFHAPQAAPVTEPFLAHVREAGAAYAAHGCVPDALNETLSCPMIPEEVYAQICNGNA